MARLVFTPQLRRFLDVPEMAVAAGTLRAALAEAFAVQPRLQGYVLDDQGHLRANVVVFIDGRRVVDRVALDDPVAPGSTVSVLQALSGG
jgi:sulfur-carrier protein